MSLALWAALYLAVYVVATAALSWAGAKKTGTFASFAAGGGQMGALPTALIAAACLTSTATFSINPGYVYTDGLAALIAFSAPVALGVTLAFYLLGPRLRETSLAADGTIKVLTLPQWIGARFDSKRLRSLFAVLVLLPFTYAVLILVGGSYVAQATFGTPTWIPQAILDLGVQPVGVYAVAIMLFVVAYTAIGGTHAHATTNIVKGCLLATAALVMGGTAASKLFLGSEPLLQKLAQADPAFLAPIREGSAVAGSAGAVFLFPLVIGFALACQPHILVKVLYVNNPAAVRRVGLASGALFLALGAPALLVGFAARAELGAALKQDQAAATWIASAFPAPLAAFLGAIMITAAIGTLNALLLSLGSTFANDVARPLAQRLTGKSTDASALLWGRLATVGVGLAVTGVALFPPKQVWLFGVIGVYALVAAACPAVIAGILKGARAGAGWIGAAAVVGPSVHLVLFLGNAAIFGAATKPNPNFTGTCGVAAGLAIVLLGRAIAGSRVGADANQATIDAAASAPAPAAPAPAQLVAAR